VGCDAAGAGEEVIHASGAAASIGWAGLAYLVLIAVVLPLGAWSSKRAHDAGVHVGPRSRLFVSIAIQQAALAGLSLLAAHLEGLDVPLAAAPAPAGWLVAVGFVVAALALARARWSLSSEERRARQMQFLPAAVRDVPLWLLVCATAGFGEELAYRGVLPGLLAGLGVAPAPAIALSAAAFALAHLVQGWVNAALVFVVALGFHAIVVAAGSLAPAMVAHALLDAVLGLAYLRLLRVAAESGASAP
jgi:membrane protease YdiL (CAAX protease family)